jgi:hypothetical protein
VKYLAILKDSFREAVDSKVFFVMLGLSALVILLIGSVAYKPVSVEDDLTRMTRLMTWGMNRQFKGLQGPSLRIEDFQQTNDAPANQPWKADYRFRFIWEFSEKIDAGQVPAAGRDALANQTQTLLRRQFSYLNDIHVIPSEDADPKAVSLIVTTHGTSVTHRGAWLHDPYVLFAIPASFLRMPLGELVHLVESTLVNTIGAAIALLLSTIITAFFIPNMLRKGTIDLLLVKPIRRPTLLVYKFVGGLLFMFLNSLFIVIGIWLVVGLRSGLWGSGFLLSIFILTYQFAVYYSISTLFAVLTRSPIVAILMTTLAWFLFFLVGTGYQIVDATRIMVDPEVGQELGLTEQEQPREKPLPDWVYSTADGLHFAFPRMKDLDALNSKLITDELMPPESQARRTADRFYASFKWGEALAVTTSYIVVFLGLSCLWFATRDY